jgi:hypothetical protein
MKKLLIALAAVLITASSYGQGRVNFATKVGTDVDAPVFIAGTQTGPGPDWSAGLYLSQNGSLTALTPTVTFRPAGTGGAAIANRYVAGQVLDVPQITPGNAATFVMRAWLTSLGSFDAAKASGGGFGESAPVTIAALGGGQLPESNLTGLQSFTVVPVPEPSVIALGVLGASALLLRRRK